MLVWNAISLSLFEIVDGRIWVLVAVNKSPQAKPLLVPEQSLTCLFNGSGVASYLFLTYAIFSVKHSTLFWICQQFKLTAFYLSPHGAFRLIFVLGGWKTERCDRAPCHAFVQFSFRSFCIVFQKKTSSSNETLGSLYFVWTLPKAYECCLLSPTSNWLYVEFGRIKRAAYSHHIYC